MIESNRFKNNSMLILVVLAIFGVVCYIQQSIQGETATGLRSIGQGGAAWGLYIIAMIFFIGIAFSGITLSVIIRLFDISTLKPISRISEIMSIIAAMMGGMCIVADLGRPLVGLLNLPKFARVASPFFGTFTLVTSGFLFSSSIYFLLSSRSDASKMVVKSKNIFLKNVYKMWSFGFKGTPNEWIRHSNSSFWLALVKLPVLLTEQSTLGFIFGIQASRPGWYSALQAPSFVVLAGVSGLGALIVVVAWIRTTMNLQKVITLGSIRWLGVALMIFTSIYIYIIAIEELTALYAGPKADSLLAKEIAFGAYSPLFWATVLLFVIAFVLLLLQYVVGKTNIAVHVVAGVMVNIASILKRFLIVVPSQTHGMMLPYPHGMYIPSWVEIGVVSGLIALGGIMFVLFMKIFPIIPMEDHDSLAHLPSQKTNETSSGLLRRRFLFIATLVIGMGLTLFGFLISARMGTDASSDPVIPFSPIIFVVGLILCFVSALVYEIVPEKEPII